MLTFGKTQIKKYYERIQKRLELKNKLSKKKIFHNISVTLTANNTFINYAQIRYQFNPYRNKEENRSSTMMYVSGGSCGFKGSKKASPMANATIGEMAGAKFKKFGHENVALFLNSTKKKRVRETVTNLAKSGLSINLIRQKSRVPFNGVRPKKQRRK